MLGQLPANLEPSKRSMTLRHLMTMNSGFYCDDGKPDAPGNEDRIQEQTESPDLYGYILNLPMDRIPGEKIVYCSSDALLAGGLLRRVAGEALPELFERLVARLFMEVPELDLVIGLTGGSYSEPAALIPQRKMVPEDILPAVH